MTALQDAHAQANGAFWKSAQTYALIAIAEAIEAQTKVIAAAAYANAVSESVSLHGDATNALWRAM